MLAPAFRAYKTIAWDREAGKPLDIRSSAEHRAFLARNGYEEVGEDRSMAPPHPEEIAARRAEQLRARDETTFEFNEDTHEAVK